MLSTYTVTPRDGGGAALTALHLTDETVGDDVMQWIRDEESRYEIYSWCTPCFDDTRRPMIGQIVFPFSDLYSRRYLTADVYVGDWLILEGWVWSPYVSEEFVRAYMSEDGLPVPISSISALFVGRMLRVGDASGPLTRIHVRIADTHPGLITDMWLGGTKISVPHSDPPCLVL